MNKNRLLTILSPLFVLTALLALAAWAVIPFSARAAEPTPDRIATGVAEAKAVAATLTAEIPVDRVATGVAEAKAIAATLTAAAPAQECVCACATSGASATPVAASAYGPTEHCSAKAGYATIELRNLVNNVKSLVFYVDGAPAATVNYAKYGCIYLNDGKHVFQWKNKSEQKQSNARSFTVNGSDAWYSGSKRPDGVRNPYDAWLDLNKPEPQPTAIPTQIPSPIPSPIPTAVP